MATKLSDSRGLDKALGKETKQKQREREIGYQRRKFYLDVRLGMRLSCSHGDKLLLYLRARSTSELRTGQPI